MNLSSSSIPSVTLKIILRNKLLTVSVIWSLLLAISSSYKLLSSVAEINKIRGQAVSLSEKNEIYALQVEESLSSLVLGSGVEKTDEENIGKAHRMMKRLSELSLKADALEKRRQDEEVDRRSKKNQGQKPNDAEQQNNKNDDNNNKNKQQERVSSLVFASEKGSHLLEGQGQLLKLQNKWGYQPGSDDLHLHRTILEQARVAARTLESMCVLEAWREYLDNFIKSMENRKDTMLYNWI